MRKTSVLLGLLLFLLAGCSHLFDSNEQTIRGGTFFPLKTGQQWKYQITEADMDISRIGFPNQFTVSVVGELNLENKSYHLVANYFVPGPSLPDTILVRGTGNLVFIRFSPEDEELLFYAFAPADTTWSVPMYVNPGTTYPYYGYLVSSTDMFVTVHWGLFQNSDRGESRWREIFQQGVGRAEIISVSQAFGKVAWGLENTQ